MGRGSRPYDHTPAGKTWQSAVVILTVALLAASCASRGGAYRERGIASWYGGKFHGRITANGEVYNMHAMTAAHKTLPFDTVVEVRNLDNGRSTVVRINDRGPFVRGRIIDLSLSAAKEIGMVGPGTARVEIRALRRAEPILTGHYAVQVGSFRDRSSAEELTRQPALRSYGSRIESHGGYHRVLVGHFARRQKALELARTLQRQGFSTLVRSL